MRIHAQTDRERSRDKKPQTNKNIVDIYNVPDSLNKQEMVFFIWKNLQKAKALIKPGNPIIDTQFQSRNPKHLRLYFRSNQQAANCLQLNGAEYGVKTLYIKSDYVQPNTAKKFNFPHIAIKSISSTVQNTFNKLFIGNFPKMEPYEIMDQLSKFGNLKSFVQTDETTTQSQCFCQFVKDQNAQQCLSKLNGKSFAGRILIAKRASLMQNQLNNLRPVNPGKSTLTLSGKPKSNLFGSDNSLFYATFDTVGYFKNFRISCVIQLRRIIPPTVQSEVIIQDLRRQLQKVGPIVRICHRNSNVYIQYQRVQYAQIAFIMLMSRKYDGKIIDKHFYDPIKFADDIFE